MAKREFKNYGLSKTQVVSKYDHESLIYELMKYDDELRIAMYDCYNQGRGVASEGDVPQVATEYVIEYYLMLKSEAAGIDKEPVV